ncbi:MAG: radical SAM protein [Candidatus Woesearchaeota archaeon]
MINMTLKPGEIFSEKPLTQQDKQFVVQIKEQNKTHTVDKTELASLIAQANAAYQKHFDKTVWFERSIFTNWTCGIADCRYCYLSTKPKLEKKAIRSRESILAEALVCKVMKWRVGYITGGLRVESTQDMTQLLKSLHDVLEYKVNMNYGPYFPRELDSFQEHVGGLGSAIESFDEQLHNFICPSKPLAALLRFLGECKNRNIPTFITIILGIGEKKSDIDTVIEKIREFNISCVQLCYLKPQQGTCFEDIHPPDPEYMAWWTAKLRIAYPKLIIKIALVKDRIEDFSLMLQAGANCFSRYMIFQDFASPFALALKQECEKVGRVLEGNFTHVPDLATQEIIDSLPFDEQTNQQIGVRFLQYVKRLQKQQEKHA